MSAITTTSINALDGLLTGAEISINYRGTESITKGGTAFVAFKQALTLHFTFKRCITALNQLGITNITKASRSWIIKILAIPIPFALQILAFHIDKEAHPYLGHAVHWLRDRIPEIALAIDLCASICIAAHSAPIFGVCMIIGASVDLAYKLKLLNPIIKMIWEKVIIGITLVQACGASMIGEMDIYEAFFIVAELIVHVRERWFVHNPPDTKHRLSALDAKRLVDLPLDKFKVNWEHVHWNPQLGIEDNSTDIEATMKKLIDSVQWNESNLKMLRGMLDKNEHFKNPANNDQYWNYVKGDENQKNEIAKAWLKKCANSLAYQIANSSIEAGNHEINYDYLKKMLRADLKNLLEAAETNEPFEEDFFQIALEGGDACAAGMYEQIESVFDRRVLGGNQAALSLKFLSKLRDTRKSWFINLKTRIANFINKISEMLFGRKLSNSLFDPNDVHLHNIGFFYFNKGLKTHSATNENDMTVEDFFCDHLYQLLVSVFLFDWLFWPFATRADGWYNPAALVDAINADSTQIRISQQRITEWWVNWSKETTSNQANQKETTAEQEEKDRVHDELYDGKLWDREITTYVPDQVTFWDDANQTSKTIFKETPKQIVNPDLVKLMLIDMGILVEKT